MLITDIEDEEQLLQDVYRRMKTCTVITIQDVFETILCLKKKECILLSSRSVLPS
jgi:hypothetical protein